MEGQNQISTVFQPQRAPDSRETFKRSNFKSNDSKTVDPLDLNSQPTQNKPSWPKYLTPCPGLKGQSESVPISQIQSSDHPDLIRIQEQDQINDLVKKQLQRKQQQFANQALNGFQCKEIKNQKNLKGIKMKNRQNYSSQEALIVVRETTAQKQGRFNKIKQFNQARNFLADNGAAIQTESSVTEQEQYQEETIKQKFQGQESKIQQYSNQNKGEKISRSRDRSIQRGGQQHKFKTDGLIRMADLPKEQQISFQAAQEINETMATGLEDMQHQKVRIDRNRSLVGRLENQLSQMNNKLNSIHRFTSANAGTNTEKEHSRVDGPEYSASNQNIEFKPASRNDQFNQSPSDHQDGFLDSFHRKYKLKEDKIGYPRQILNSSSLEEPSTKDQRSAFNTALGRSNFYSNIESQGSKNQLATLKGLTSAATTGKISSDQVNSISRHNSIGSNSKYQRAWEKDNQAVPRLVSRLAASKDNEMEAEFSQISKQNSSMINQILNHRQQKTKSDMVSQIMQELQNYQDRQISQSELGGGQKFNTQQFKSAMSKSAMDNFDQNQVQQAYLSELIGNMKIPKLNNDDINKNEIKLGFGQMQEVEDLNKLQQLSEMTYRYQPNLPEQLVNPSSPCQNHNYFGRHTAMEIIGAKNQVFSEQIKPEQIKQSQSSNIMGLVESLSNKKKPTPKQQSNSKEPLESPPAGSNNFIFDQKKDAQIQDIMKRKGKSPRDSINQTTKLRDSNNINRRITNMYKGVLNSPSKEKNKTTTQNNLPEIKNEGTSKGGIQFVQELKQSRDEESFNFIKKQTMTNPSGAFRIRDTTSLFDELATSNTPDELIQKVLRENQAHQITPNQGAFVPIMASATQYIQSQQQQLHNQHYTKSMQQRNLDSKKLLVQVIRELEMRGLIAANASSRIYSKRGAQNTQIANNALEVSGVSPKYFSTQVGQIAMAKRYESEYQQYLDRLSQATQLCPQQIVQVNQMVQNAPNIQNLQKVLKMKKQTSQGSFTEKNEKIKLKNLQRNGVNKKIAPALNSQGTRPKEAKLIQNMPIMGFTPETFNSCCNTINNFLQLTLTNKRPSVPTTTNAIENSGSMTPQVYQRIILLGKKLHFPNDFCRKAMGEMAKFVKTKDFLVLVKSRMHTLFNRMIVQQFNLHQRRRDIQQPAILRAIISGYDTGASTNHHQTIQVEGSNRSPDKRNSDVIMESLEEIQDPKTAHTLGQLSFKFYTDSTGNNHPVVRQILKRRTWLQRIEKVKVAQQFEQTSLFWTQWRKDSVSNRLGPYQIYAKIDGNYLITNKTSLFSTMSEYYKNYAKRDPFEFMPETYNILTEKNMSQNQDFSQIVQKSKAEGKYIWICKPGENSNRGRGIRIFTCIDKIQRFLEHKSGESWVVQKYIYNPILIGGKFWNDTPMRKFDIRMFGVAQIVDGIHFRGYTYKECYIRTSSYKFDLSDLEDRDVHLTNDAVQDRNEEYGKYEAGNKISQKDFAIYLSKHRKVDFQKQIWPQMKEAIKCTLQALWLKIQALNLQAKLDGGKVLNKYNNFELFGYDFMIDENLKVYLIEVNTNPCLDTAPCPLLQRLISQVLDQTFKLCVDPFLSSPDPKRQEQQYIQSQEITIQEFHYEMVFSNASEYIQKRSRVDTQITQQNLDTEFSVGELNLIQEPTISQN